MKKFFGQNGQTLIEIILTIGLASIVIPAILTGAISQRGGKAQLIEKDYATPLLKEAQEATRSVRERGWSAFSVNGIFHPEIVSGEWILAPNEEAIGNFRRKITISDVERNESGVVVSEGGTVDPSTKKVVATVSWDKPYASLIESTMYLTRYKNASYTETTLAQFNQGTKNGVTITNTQGGEVLLGAGGGGDWCSPNTSIVASLDLPKNGVANALSAYQGRAIAGTGENSSGVSLADINITNTSPPTPSITQTFNGYKTNDVYIDGNFAYIATDDNQKEIVIIDLTTSTEVGSFNSDGPWNATSVFVLGNRGYMTSGLTLYIFDLSSKVGSRPKLGSYLFLGSATSVVVSGNYAYVSLALSIIELQIIDIENPQSLFNIGWADVNATDGKKVFVNSSATRAYLATGQDTNRREFFIIDISSKNGARPTVGSYDSSGMNPAGLSVVPGNKALLVGSGAEEYQVIDITNESSPSRCGGLNIDTGIRGVVGILENDGDAYSYIVTGDQAAELKILEGGPGGQFSTSGTFESQTFDASSEVAFNRIFVSADKPSSSDIKYQIAVSDANQQTGTCSGISFNFLGPGGSTNSYYASDSVIFLNSDGLGYENPGQCFKYKAFLSTQDPTQTPVLYDITVNYSL